MYNKPTNYQYQFPKNYGKDKYGGSPNQTLINNSQNMVISSERDSRENNILSMI